MFSYEHYDALTTRAGLVDRSARGRLRLTGADRRTYLQGLLTNDVAALEPGHGCYAALLTPQGRMISDMRVSELGDAILIDLPGSTAETVGGRLSDFIFSEDVQVEDLREAWSHAGVYGPGAAGALSAALDIPAASLESIGLDANLRVDAAGGAIVVVRSNDYGDGFELLAPRAVVDRAIELVTAHGVAAVSAETADVVRIENGRAEFGVDMDAQTIPLEAGIEDRAISLTKGCYVGQEVIIRVLHRGQGRVAKHLVGLVAAADAALDRGARLHADGKDVGVVTSASTSPKVGRRIALGYVHRDHVAPGSVLQAGESADAVAVTVVSLPFSSADR